MERLIVSLVIAAAGAATLLLSALKCLQIYQLSSYRIKGLWGWFRKTRFDIPARLFAFSFFSFTAMFVYLMCFKTLSDEYSFVKYFGLLFYVGVSALFIAVQAKTKQKPPLKFTARVIRFSVVYTVLAFGLCFAATYCPFETFFSYAFLGVTPLFAPIIISIAHFILLPVETLINRGYEKRAAAALSARRDLIKIGITGSYGKTTAKNILAELLGCKYRVVASPESYNTPMGLAKTINDGLGDCEVFIAEMGARRIGDISRLCDMIKPDYAMITAVGSQHLETFGSVENVISAKLEITATEFTVIDGDNELLVARAAELGGRAFAYCGANGEAYCDDVQVGADGTTFTLTIGDESRRITTPLLGRHVAKLCAECALMAHKLGVETDKIAAALGRLKPIPHRLQLIKNAAYTIIDDAYNSNPTGAANAIEVLTAFDGAKVVITPGFAELGDMQNEENFNLGKRAAAADYLISVNNSEIIKGAIAGGMAEEKAVAAQNLDDAVRIFRELGLSGATVLFLNDLPDNY